MSALSRLIGVSMLFAAMGCAGDTATGPNPARLGRDQSAANGPKNSEQVVFSGVAGINSTFQHGSPVGFWIWCMAESDNSYNEECNGSMYLYALGITRHVEGEITELSDGIYQMTVSSTRDGAIINCVLTNPNQATSGPSNTVTVSCTTPNGSASSSNAVVVVTGP